METTRQSKVSRLLQRDLGEIFQREGSRLFGGAMITVTKVHITRDLAVAKVYLSLFATIDKEQLIEKVRNHSKDIRFKL